MSDKINPFEKKKKGVFFFKSSNPYEFYDLLNGKNMDDKQDVWGTLIFPEKLVYPKHLVYHPCSYHLEDHKTHMD